MITNKTTVTRGDVYLYWLRRYLTNPSVFLFFWIPIVCYVFFALRDHDPLYVWLTAEFGTVWALIVLLMPLYRLKKSNVRPSENTYILTPDHIEHTCEMKKERYEIDYEYVSIGHASKTRKAYYLVLATNDKLLILKKDGFTGATEAEIDALITERLHHFSENRITKKRSGKK